MAHTHRIRFNILAKDIQQSMRFYRRVFGMVEAEGESRSWVKVLVLPGEKRFEVALVDEVSEYVPRGSRGIAEGAYITFVVDDVVAAVVEAHEEGVEVIEDAYGAGNDIHAVIRDPNGVIIDLFTPEAARHTPPSELLS